MITGVVLQPNDKKVCKICYFKQTKKKGNFFKKIKALKAWESDFNWLTHVNTNVIWDIALQFDKLLIKQRDFPSFSWHRKLYIHIFIFLYLVLFISNAYKVYVKYTICFFAKCARIIRLPYIKPLSPLFILHGFYTRCNYFKAQWLQIENLHRYNDTITKK